MAGSFFLRNLLRSKNFGSFLCFTLIIHIQQGFGQENGEIETFDLLMPNVLPKKVSEHFENIKLDALLYGSYYLSRKSTDQYMYAI